MPPSQAITPDDLAHYEGLVHSTAARYVSVMAGAAMDFDDICQVLRIKVWKALEVYDPTRWADRDRYVFMCVRNQGKDLVKRRTPDHIARDSLMIEDVAPTVNGNGAIRDAFELRYLSSDEEQSYMDVLEEPPMIPSTLTSNERRVLKLLYHEFRQAEMAPILKLSPSQVKGCVKGIRAKMADWAPDEAEPIAA